MSQDPQFPHLPAEAWTAFLADSLGASSLASLEDHLDGCPECRTVLEAHDPSRLFRRLRNLQVRADRQDELWTGFFEGIEQGIEEQGLTSTRRRAPSSSGTRKPNAWRERLSYLAGAASFLIGALLFQSDGAPSRRVETLPCPPEALALVNVQRPLSCEEHRSLFDVHFEAPGEVLVQPSLDLGTL